MDKNYYRFSVVILMTIAATLIFSGCAPKEPVKPWSNSQLRKISMAFSDVDPDKNEISGNLLLNRNGAPKPTGITHYVVYWSKSLRKPIQKGDEIVQSSVGSSNSVLFKFGENTKIDPNENRYFVLFLKDSTGKEVYSQISTKLVDISAKSKIIKEKAPAPEADADMTEEPVADGEERQETKQDLDSNIVSEAGPNVPGVGPVVPGAPVAAIAGPDGVKSDDGTSTEIVAILIKDVLFAFDKSVITDEFSLFLEETFSNVDSLEDVKVKISGHADERGSNEYNLALGYRRAYAVKQYLISLGLSEENIEIISFGEQMPADLGHNEKAWAKNRRAESKIQ